MSSSHTLPQHPSSISQVSEGGGDVGWDDPNFALSTSGEAANVTLASGQDSKDLHYEFAAGAWSNLIPAGATITGIGGTIEGVGGGGDDVTLLVVPYFEGATQDGASINVPPAAAQGTFGGDGSMVSPGAPGGAPTRANLVGAWAIVVRATNGDVGPHLVTSGRMSVTVYYTGGVAKTSTASISRGGHRWKP